MSVATAATALQTKRDNLVTELAGIDVNGPDISLDGVSISQMEYARKLEEQIAVLTDQIEKFLGPCVVFSLGR